MRRFNKSIFRIVIHIAGWVLLYVIPPLALQTQVRLPSGFGDLLYWSLVIIFFYVNYLWLIPKYLTKRKFAIYFLGIAIMLATCYFANEIYIRHRVNAERAKTESTSQIESQNDSPRKVPRFRGYFSALFCFAVLMLGTSIRVTENWYENEKQKKEMENQKLGAELSFLKSQINPHFFFNTLNSIYSLSIIKSDKTSEAVIKLSDLMRYIIYDTERKVVPLSREVEYIGNYIELQRLRLPEDIKVHFKTSLGECESVIEPLLLLPFVENAFKHGVDIEKGGKIKIEIFRKEDELHLHVENPLVEYNNNGRNGQSGIGINNTLKRLDLLYQDKFTFNAGPVKNNYVVDLILKLKDNEVFDS